MEVPVNSQDVSFSIVAVGSAAHLTGLTAADFNIWYHRPGNDKVFIPLTDKTFVTDPHNDGELIEIGNGAYQIDGPDEMFIAGVPNVKVGGSCTGGNVIVLSVDLNSSTLGSGSDYCTIEVKTDEGSPVPDANVWVTRDPNGDFVVAGTRQTDSNGKVLFLLDNGAQYHLWVQKDGIESIDGELFIAQKDS